MRAIFLDTAGWFAAMSPKERGHAVAAGAYADARTSGTALVTTDLVVAEMHTLILRTRGTRDAQTFLEAALSSPSHAVIYADADLVSSAVARWIRAFKDQEFSLCDAVSFEVMRRERIPRALTFDRHFATAGFEMLG
ncbi:MAG: type II toxin-antitoxin system VapC family toxin [Gemmatimonadaceae bacterium]